jgi:hypothetical protein
MLFDNLPASKPAVRRAKNEPVLSVGGHACVNWPQPAAQPPRPVPMTDATGKPLANDLTDGQEVEIVSWRPRSREGLAYQIRRLSDGSEWWIAAVYLRRLRAAQAGADGESALHALPVAERR